MEAQDVALTVFLCLCAYGVPAILTGASVDCANRHESEEKRTARAILGAIFWPIVAVGAILYCVWWAFYHAFKKED